MPPWLPALNTGLILVSGACLAVGYAFIRRRRITAHHRSMITASIFAGLFLVVYVARAVLYGSKAFEGPSWAYTLYLGILAPHVVLAIAVAPLALITLGRALRGDFPRHRRIARITLPIWVFVALSGWVVYFLLYGVSW